MPESRFTTVIETIRRGSHSSLTKLDTSDALERPETFDLPQGLEVYCDLESFLELETAVMQFPSPGTQHPSRNELFHGERIVADVTRTEIN